MGHKGLFPVMPSQSESFTLLGHTLAIAATDPKQSLSLFLLAHSQIGDI